MKGLLLLLLPALVPAGETINLTGNTVGLGCLFLFLLGYLAVILEEKLHLKKSKPLLLVSSLMWFLVAYEYNRLGHHQKLVTLVEHNILEFAQLMLFILVAITYINAMTERGVFDAVESKLVHKNLNFRQIYWLTGLLAFFISPIADNMTTAILMCAVVMAIGKDDKSFISNSCVNIVIAANAGGAYSPFGDITTLMVWQHGALSFFQFFKIFIPSLVSYLIPAYMISLKIPETQPPKMAEHKYAKPLGYFIVFLFIVTVTIAIVAHHYFHLPPSLGMMAGLSLLSWTSYYYRTIKKNSTTTLNIFNYLEKLEWDTLLFFFGIIMCIGALNALGYLSLLSHFMYTSLGAGLPLGQQETPANILVGLISAVVDNIPVMYAVLTMNPVMSEGQWLLVTLTAGIGGSLLSVGSAAGVAVMGQAKNYYTFSSHLKWSFAIALGYVAAIGVHLLINHGTF